MADPPESPTPVPSDGAGRGIIRASWIGTGVFSVTAILSAIAPRTFIALSVGVALILFFAGMAIFLWAYAVAVGRSRTDLIGMGGLFFLAGSAPRAVQRTLLGSLIVEVVVALGTAAVHPFTPLAFGVLAPMYGLALCGLWAARHGQFPPRPPEEKRARKTKAGGADGETTPTTKSRTPASGQRGAKAGAKAGGRSSSGRTTPRGSKGSAKRAGR
jgi:hypothetical protein